MEFIDLETQYRRIERGVAERVKAVLEGHRFIMGPEVEQLESELAAYVGSRHCLTCGSGTQALVMALMGMGVKAGDAVFVPSFTFFASAESITLAGATPVFVDSDPKTFNMAPDDLERAIAEVREQGGLVPRGIVAVDLFGQPADYDAIRKVADEHGLFILEDAAQAFGSIYRGRRACSLGDVSATSFFPAKPLGCYGDGGAVFTDDDHLAEIMRSIRVHGQGASKYENVRIGINGRLDTLQAAVLLSKLEIFDDEVDRRQSAASRYVKRLSGLVKTPSVADGATSVWAQFTIVADSTDQRAAIADALAADGIPTAIYYPTPIHRSVAYSGRALNDRSLPVCEALAGQVLSLPMHPYLDDGSIDRVCAAVARAVGQ